MVIEQHAGSLITGGFALAGAILGYWGSLKTQKMAAQAENNRRRADHLLEKEADLLFQLLEDAEKCQSVAKEYRGRALQENVTDSFLITANEALMSFESTAQRSKVFLDEDRQESVESLLGTVRSTYVYSSEKSRGNSERAERLEHETLVDDFEGFIESLESFMKERIGELESGN